MFENLIYYIHESANTQNVSTGDKSVKLACAESSFRNNALPRSPDEKSFNFLQFSPYMLTVAKGLSLQERNILFVDSSVKQKHIHLDTDG